MNNQILKHFADFIESQLGIIYSEAAFYQLEFRLNQLSQELGFKSLGEFYDAHATHISEPVRLRLIDLATNNETSFFRDRALFETLDQIIFPVVMKSKTSGDKVSIWSAACSSGQEAISAAIVFDRLQKQHHWPNPSFLLTDISQSILDKAKSGIYTRLEVSRGLGATDLKEHFSETEEGQFKLQSSLLNLFQFKVLNLLGDFSGLDRFDIIFCRNVLIYQSVENRKKVVEKIHKCLSSEGYLILGAAESLIGISDLFEQESVGSSIVFRPKGFKIQSVKKESVA